MMELKKVTGEDVWRQRWVVEEIFRSVPFRSQRVPLLCL